MQEQPEQSEVRPITTPSAYVSDGAQAGAENQTDPGFRVDLRPNGFGDGIDLLKSDEIRIRAAHYVVTRMAFGLLKPSMC